MRISKELLSEVLGEKVIEVKRSNLKNRINIKYYTIVWGDDRPGYFNIYELAHLNLKEWAKSKNVFDIIDWSGTPEQIFTKAEELRNELN